MKFESIDAVLSYAIGKEEEAAQFYADLAEQASQGHIRELLLGFAEEEKGHRATLLDVRDGRQMLGSEQRVMDLKIGDHMLDVQLDATVNYQQALIVAMKAEKAAYKLYHDLASATDDPGIRALFLDLAQAEAKHKLRFEIEYDDAILSEN